MEKASGVAPFFDAGYRMQEYVYKSQETRGKQADKG